MRRYDKVDANGVTCIVVPVADYDRLLLAAEADDTLRYCESCGAWMDIQDPYLCSTDDFTGCWKAAAGQKYERECRSYRAPDNLSTDLGKTSDAIIAACCVKEPS